MRNKTGIICMVLGAALILAALSLFVWNEREDYLAEKSIENILPQIEQVISVEAASNPDPYDPVMTEKEIDGYFYIGYVSIPALGLRLPVMSEWDYGRLKIAPCRYAGSVKTDDLVIAAHNYTRHFGKLDNLSAGDTVTFVDMDGVVSNYQVAAMDILEPTAVEEMTAGEYDLTLFTCTYGGRSRVTIRCNRTNEP